MAKGSKSYGSTFSPNGSGASSANNSNAGHIDSVMGREYPSGMSVRGRSGQTPGKSGYLRRGKRR